MPQPDSRIWPPAGAWIRRWFPQIGWATARWHVFTGDAVWRVDWAGPSLETECGYRTGPMWALEDLSARESVPDAPCRICLRARRTEP